MMLLIRKLKYDQFMSGKTRKYVLYAIGEVALIIAGIMIALQIDNWNSDRQQRALLDSYLQSIARNMRADASEIEQLGAVRRARSIDAIRSTTLTGHQEYTYQIPEIFFFNKVASQAAENLSFRSDSSGYESLKSSGVMSLMQGDDIERVLSRYYEQVALIADLEQRHNEAINQFYLQYLMSFPDEFPQWMFTTPRALPPELLEDLQPFLLQMVNGSAVRQMISYQALGALVVREYQELVALGNSFVEMVESGLRRDIPRVSNLKRLTLLQKGEPKRRDQIA